MSIYQIYNIPSCIHSIYILILMDNIYKYICYMEYIFNV